MYIMSKHQGTTPLGALVGNASLAKQAGKAAFNWPSNPRCVHGKPLNKVMVRIADT